MALCEQCKGILRDGMNVQIIVFRGEFQLIVRLSDCSFAVGLLLHNDDDK